MSHPIFSGKLTSLVTLTGTEFEIVGKAAHNSTVQLIKRMYNDWYYIKTDSGIEGFCSRNYLQQI